MDGEEGVFSPLLAPLVDTHESRAVVRHPEHHGEQGLVLEGEDLPHLRAGEDLEEEQDPVGEPAAEHEVRRGAEEPARVCASGRHEREC